MAEGEERGRLFGDLPRRQDKEKRPAAAAAVIEGMIDVVGISDIQGKLTQINTAVEDWGYKKEELIGKPVGEVLAKRSLPKLEEERKKTLETGVMRNLELIGLKKDGSEFPVLVNVTLMKDAEGKPIGRIFAVRDITERKRAEEKLKESEEHYRIFASYRHAISELRKFYIVDATFEQMVQKTLDSIIEKFGYYMAWYAELIEKEKIILPKLWAGKYEKYLDGLRLEYESDKRDAKCAMSLAILTKKPFGYADLEHDKDFEKWRAFALQYGYRSNQAIPFIVDGKCKSAFLIYSTRPFAFSEKLVEYLKGAIDELATIIRNITERKRAEEEVKRARDDYLTITNLTDDIIVKIDREGRWTFLNDGACKFWGKPREKLLGLKFTDYVHPDDAEKANASIQKIIKAKQIMRGGTNRQKTPKGWRMVEWNSTPIFDEAGNYAGMQITGRDITELKRAEEERVKAVSAVTAAVVAAAKAKTEALEKAKKILEKRVKERTKELEESKNEAETLLTELDGAYKELKGTQDELVRREKLIAAGGLAAGVAHEIRNPLSIIGMSVQYLHSKFKEDDPRREFTEAIIDKVEKLDGVTKELIDYARPRKLNLQKRNIHKILNRILRLSEHKCHAQKVKIIKRYAKSMPRISVDDDLMEQVFLNLMSNALWAMPKGGNLTVTTKNRKATDSLEIRFTDTGCGIPEKEIDRIFDPFFTTRSDGSGLGLSVVHRIMEDHKGSIDVESEVRNGTTFTITLPVKS